MHYSLDEAYRNYEDSSHTQHRIYICWINMNYPVKYRTECAKGKAQKI